MKYSEFKSLLKEELSVYKVNFARRFIKSENFRIYSYQKALRYAEFWHLKVGSSKGGAKFVYSILYVLALKRLNKQSEKTGFNIGLHVCGWGLRFLHVGPVTINGNAHIGKNFYCYPQTLIGHSGFENVPVIGNNVSLCYGARVIGKVVIGDNTVIGPNTLIIKDVPENAVMVTAPGSVLKYRIKDQTR